MNSNCLLPQEKLNGPFKDLLSNVVYNSCKEFLLKDKSDSYVANELDNYIKNAVNSVNESKLISTESKPELKPKKKRHRKRKKKTKTIIESTSSESEHYSENESDINSDNEKENDVETEPYIHISINDKTVQENIDRYKIKPGASLRFGTNRAIVSDKVVTNERARMQFVNICWLSTIPDQAELSTIVSVRAAEMFITFQYAIELYDSMKEKHYVERYLEEQVTVVKRDGDLENKLKNSEEISNFINKVDFSQVVAKTERFGDIGYPTDEELIEFATNFRFCRHL